MRCACKHYPDTIALKRRTVQQCLGSNKQGNITWRYMAVVFQENDSGIVWSLCLEFPPEKGVCDEEKGEVASLERKIYHVQNVHTLISTISPMESKRGIV